ncbi:MAG: Dam family site-specific DNA-(adenine-N6)-methyltransferase [Lachnospiraceae bacterium]|jgi:DNA adenine methylase|nr:Dam family site-specific DNA-(adenine-N6)-methyltransferase [Lachnospiraceae bacterium]MCX4316529.1 Dam family site-specific DNA-(adenine-N6)-methyltransferase [Lachnospiraceae bacterium]
MNQTGLTPFIKWAGGKRQLLTQIKERMPEHYRRYYEPFVGGGAVIFELQPANALINDINKALINVYQQICRMPEEFIKKVQELDAGLAEYGVAEPTNSKSRQKEAKEKEGAKQYYYTIRKQYNERLAKECFDVELAARFVFLNKHCFNGLYRVNGQGLFNVPYNNSVSPSIDESSIRDISAYLQKVTILEGDFEEACKEAKEGDFVFIDSPYAPLNPSSFESYTKEGFDLESHKRLARLFDELTERGCYCMLTNHNTELIHELYGEKGYQVDVVGVKRLINSDATKRVGEEVIIYNYNVQEPV